MYTRNSFTISSKEDLANYIEDLDVYNSELLNRMSSPGIERVTYTINLYEYRPDLISKDFYGSLDYEGLLLIQAGGSLSNFYKGATLKLIPKDILNSIINGII